MFETHFAKEFKNRKVKFYRGKDIEPHEVILDKLAQKREQSLGISEIKFEVPLPKKILKGFFILGAIAIFFLFVKTFQYQAINKDEFVAKAEANKFVSRSIQTLRGVIYDFAGKQLVFNRPSFDLIADKNKLPKSEEAKKDLLRKISEIIQANPEEIGKKIADGKEQYVTIAENLNEPILLLLETKITDFAAFEIKKNAIREYEDGSVFSHIIGYTGQINPDELKKNSDIYSQFDYVGRDGVEKTYESELRKNPGKVIIERDAHNNVISQQIVTLPESGNNLVLWLDAGLQKKAVEEITKTLQAFGAERAAAVALDPKTGGVMALVSLPSYDNNAFSKDADPKIVKELLNDEKQPLFDRAIAGYYPTGSTIKPLTAAAALQEKLISPEEDLGCPGKITITHKYDPTIIYEYKDWTTHGIVNMRTAIAQSCNVYFYTIGGGYENQKGLGPTRIKKYLELFGWGRKTQIDLPGESEGFIPSPEWKKDKKGESWFDGDTYNLSIGQGYIGITPLQVATSFMAIANGGTVYQPQVVKKIIDSNKDTISEISPKILQTDFIDSENLQVVREGMRMTVTGENSPQATATSLRLLPVSAAAKTGTAQTTKAHSYNNWVTVFAPYEDPQIVLTIMVENVGNSESAAVPIAREILNWYFTEDQNKK